VYDLIHTSGDIPLTQNTYQIPATLSSGQPLEPGRQYQFSLVLYNDSTRAEVSRSFTYVGYSVLSSTPSAPVYLPLAGTGLGGAFSFLPINVAADQEILIDPSVAVGYAYKIRAGDPLFKSVRLPDVGDGKYEIEYLVNGSLTRQQVLADQSFSFPGIGVDQFKVLGIEPEAGLDPQNPTAFVTALTFEGPGVFAGTMTPLVVPEASTWLTMLAGFMLVGWGMRRNLSQRASADALT
jgi:hypothetical protein